MYKLWVQGLEFIKGVYGLRFRVYRLPGRIFNWSFGFIGVLWCLDTLEALEAFKS